MATPIRIDGFEHGVVSTNGTGLFNSLTNSTYISIQNTYARNSGYAIRFNVTSAGTCYANWTIASTYVTVASFWVMYHAWPSGAQSEIFCSCPSGSSDMCVGIRLSDKKFIVWVSGQVANAKASSITASLDTWYQIDVRYTATGGVDTIDWYVDGTAQQQYTYNTTSVAWTTVNIGPHLTSTTVDVVVDDLVVSSTSGDFPLSVDKVQKRAPAAGATGSAPGSVIKDNGGTVIDDSTNPAYVEIDDALLSDGTDYVAQTGTGASNWGETDFQDTSESTFIGVSAFMSYQTTATQTNNGQFRIRDGAGQETTIYSGAMNVTSRYYKSGIVTKPAADWSQTTVNGLLGRIGYSSDANPEARWHVVMIQVASKAGAITLSPEEGYHTNAGDAAALTQTNVLAPAEGVQTNAGDEAALVQKHNLAPTEGAQVQEGDSATLGISIALFPQEGSQDQAGDVAAIVQRHSILPAEGAQENAGDVAAIVQVHALGPQEGAQVQAGDAAAIALVTTLSPVEGSQDQAGDSQAITQRHVIGPQEGAQVQAGDEASIVQKHVLQPAEGAQDQAGDSATINTAANLSPVEGAQDQAGDSAALVQRHAIAPAEGAQVQAGDQPAIIQVHNLQPQEGSQTQAGDQPAITRVVTVSPAEGFQDMLGDVPAIVQRHNLQPQEGSQEQAGDNAVWGIVLHGEKGSQSQAGDPATLIVGVLTTYEFVDRLLLLDRIAKARKAAGIERVDVRGRAARARIGTDVERVWVQPRVEKARLRREI